MTSCSRWMCEANDGDDDAARRVADDAPQRAGHHLLGRR